MKIVFCCIGLTFEAEVNYTPGTPACGLDPPDEAEMEFISLTCDGLDASFLLDSTVWLTIEDAAYQAAGEQYAAEARFARMEAMSELALLED